MNCEDIKKVLSNYVLHIAPEDEMRQVEEHLCTCDSCRQRLNNHMDESSDERVEVKAMPKKNSGIFEYAVIGIGALTLIYCIFLFLQR